MSKIKVDTVKEATQEVQSHVIPEVGIIPKTDTRVYITSAQKYNTISRTKRSNHITTFKNAPKYFPMEQTEKYNSLYRIRLKFSHRPPKYTIIVEPTENHIHSETTGNVLVYRDLVKIDETIWTTPMYNELSRLFQRSKTHAGTYQIEFILHRYKPK